VTEWRQWPSWRKLAAIAHAPVSGAATAGSLAAESMADLVEAIGRYAPDAYPDAVFEIADEVAASQPAIAPLVNLANTVHLRHREGPDALAGELRATAMRMDASAGVLSRAGSALVPEGSTVLTMGWSGSVRDLLKLAGDRRRFSVACAETMPFGEGIELASDLVSEGLRVEVVPDDQILDVLPGVDLVIIGAAAFGPTSVLAIVGAAEIARVAERVDIPMYVVASIEKALPDRLFRRAAAAGAGQFEEIPLVSLRAVVTEIGVLDSLSAGAIAADRRLSPDLMEKISRSDDE